MPFRRFQSIACALCITLSAGCSPRLTAEAVFTGDHFILTTDLPYGEDTRHLLDVYAPRDGDGEAPVVVFLYGGRWQAGDKEVYRLLGNALTRRGYVTVVPNYRLAPAVSFPAWVEDAASAIHWASDHAPAFGGDPGKLFVIGHSAGGHSVALLALDPRYLAREGLSPDSVRGFVSIAGPVGTEWTDPDVQALMGPAAGWPATYPATHADGSDPPLRLLHGTGDETVSAENSLRLARSIREQGGCARATLYPGVGHIEIIVSLLLPQLAIAPTLEDVVRFFDDPVGDTCPEDGREGP